ncbi:hypothetical protein AYI68_g4498 [Smittium mucronatum]|uniref:Pre-rRNA-processing protein RIX1 N-terminal domain-containing protein n=1 Tax=Smittium mucronatum TaxID=133383 RepID=A0A1R0GWY0_9FUNG|nr:hypothetical protein AYI68_g4498 [Smittium mucronatum]
MSSVSKAESQLSVLLNNFLSNEDSIQATFPFIIESLNLKNLLNPEFETSNNGISTGNFQPFKKLSVTNIPETNIQNDKEYKSFNNLLLKWATRLTALVISKKPESRYCSKTESQDTINAAISALVSIFSIANGYLDLEKDIVIPSVSKFNTSLLNLLKSHPELLPSISSAIIWSSRLFPGLIRLQVEKTIRSCVHFLNGSYVPTHPEFVAYASECISSLSIVSGKFSSSERWLENLNKTLNSINNSLNKIYNSVDIEKRENLIPEYEFDKDSDDFMVYLPLLADRCASLVELVAALIT